MVNSVVQDQDQSQGDVKCPKCGINSVDDVVVLDAALTGNTDAVVVSPEQGGHRYENRDSPHGGYHQPSPSCRSFPGVFDSVRDGPVPVQCNDTQMKDGARATGHVDAEPDLTDEVPQGPFIYHYVSDAQGHDEDSHEEICHSQ